MSRSAVSFPSRFPAPYRAALAISTDVDFCSAEALFDLYGMLCGGEESSFGPGLDLEIGWSLFFASTDPLVGFTYFEDVECRRPSKHAPRLRELICSGAIDTLHAYGHFDESHPFKQETAERILEECERHNLRFPFWTNHGDTLNRQNVGGPWSSYQEGDDPSSPFYHLDITRRLGVKYWWMDNGCAINEWPQRIDQVGRRYGDNTLLVRAPFRDGTERLYVKRYRGPERPSACNLHRQITPAMLNSLVESGQAVIIYQHLGAWRGGIPNKQAKPNFPPYFAPADWAILKEIARLCDEGLLWVTTPSRLLARIEERFASE